MKKISCMMLVICGLFFFTVTHAKQSWFDWMVSFFKSSRQPSLFTAIQERNLEKIKERIAAGENIEQRDALGLTPLLKAAVQGDGDIVAFLLSKGARDTVQDNDGRGALHYACLKGNFALVSLLLEHLQDRAATVLNDPYFNIDEARKKQLIKAYMKKYVNAQDMYGVTPLHKCFERNNRAVASIVALLMGNGADPNIQDYSHLETPLHYACKRLNEPGEEGAIRNAIIVVLLTKKPNLFLRDKAGIPLSEMCIGTISKDMNIPIRRY